MTGFPLPRRARTRLALWYALVLAGSLVLLGSLGLWIVDRSLHTGVDELLRFKAGAVSTEVDVEKGRLVADLDGAKSSDARALTAGLDIVSVWDTDLRPVHQFTSDPSIAPPEHALLEALVTGRLESHSSTVLTLSSESYRAYAEPIERGGRVIGIVEVGRSLAEIERILAQLRLLGGVGVLLAMVLGGLGGWFLSGRALAPVVRITRAAEQIGAEDLARRLNLSLPDDELGRLARAFDAMIDRLDQAFRRQRQFTADASHELRTPLSVIRSQVDVALSRPRESAYYVRVLGSVREESHRLEQLTQNLLTLARSDGETPPPLTLLDLEALVMDDFERLAPRARDRGVELRLETSPMGEIAGHEALLGQLLGNLVDNAVRHTPMGGHVTLRLGESENEAILEVADSGEGIAPEHLPHLTERFYRADRSRNRDSGGAGLGLAICEWIVRLHGGRLEITSAPGEGTTVRASLPSLSPAPRLPLAPV